MMRSVCFCFCSSSSRSASKMRIVRGLSSHLLNIILLFSESLASSEPLWHRSSWLSATLHLCAYCLRVHTPWDCFHSSSLTLLSCILNSPALVDHSRWQDLWYYRLLPCWNVNTILCCLPLLGVYRYIRIIPSFLTSFPSQCQVAEQCSRPRSC